MSFKVTVGAGDCADGFFFRPIFETHGRGGAEEKMGPTAPRLHASAFIFFRVGRLVERALRARFRRTTGLTKRAAGRTFHRP